MLLIPFGLDATEDDAIADAIKNGPRGTVGLVDVVITAQSKSFLPFVIRTEIRAEGTPLIAPTGLARVGQQGLPEVGDSRNLIVKRSEK